VQPSCLEKLSLRLQGAGEDFVREATRLTLGAPRSQLQARNPLDMDFVAVKAPMFSFRRLSGVDPILGVEMASTGEVGCFGEDGDEAFMKAMVASGFQPPSRGVLLSLGPVAAKYRFVDDARMLLRMGLKLFGTPGTADMLRAEGSLAKRSPRTPRTCRGRRRPIRWRRGRSTS